MPEASPPSEKAIFLAALDHEEGEARGRFLDEACAGNPVLRDRLEQLLCARTPDEVFPAMPDPTRISEVAAAGSPAAPGDAIGYFGEYLLLGEIARGGSGVVFRARQTSLNRTVALKMLRLAPGPQDESLARRFRAEAEAAATLDHPGIVPIYEVGVHEGQDYFSMKLVEGGTLSSRIAEYQADARRAAELMAKVCRAVHHAHQQAILHRDIKPGNILVDAQGEPHVTDFGLARNLDMDLDLTVTGMVMGTPHYMSPEQARGESRRLTVATDVYSLGAVLFELMAGRRAFTGETVVDVLQRVTNDPPPRLRSVRPQADRDMETMVARCLEKSPASRYSSADALAQDLEHWLRGEPIAARPAGALERLRKWARRKPALATAAGLAALLAVALVVALAVSRHLVGQALKRTESALTESRESFHRAEGRVDYMTKVLPDLLEPVGRLDLLDGPFRNVDEYYISLPPDAQDAAGKMRHAAFLTRWSEVLWKTGRRRERLDRLVEAAALVRAALAQPGTQSPDWLTATKVFRALSDARGQFNDPAGASTAAAEARAALEKGRAQTREAAGFAREEARLDLLEVLRLRARGDHAGAAALAASQAPQWRSLLSAALTASAGEARETRSAAGEFYSEWGLAERAAGNSLLAVGTEYEQRMAEAVKAAPDDASVRFWYSAALSFLGAAHTELGNMEQAADCQRRYLESTRAAAAMDPGSLALKAEVHCAEGLYAGVLREAGDFAGSLQLLESAVRGFDAIQARDGALDTFVDGARAPTLARLAETLHKMNRSPEACDAIEQALAARLRRTAARSMEWSEHLELDASTKLYGNLLLGYNGKEVILPIYERLLEKLRSIRPSPGTEAFWAWTRGSLLRRLALIQFIVDKSAAGLERAAPWMAESHRERLAAISLTGAVPELLADAALAITTWLDHSPEERKQMMIAPVQELAAAIPVARRLGPEARWRQEWADAFARTAPLMAPETAAAFCRRADEALFGQPCGRDWTAEELEARARLRALFSP